MTVKTVLFLAIGPLVFSLVPGTAASAAEKTSRVIGPATVLIRFPEELGGMQRPPVEFDHAAHDKALEAEGCEKCHIVDDNGLTPVLTVTLDVSERDALIDVFHDACMGCHEQRAGEALKAGPVTCGECHRRRRPGVSARSPMAFDSSLHARHAQAFPEKCDTCHHIWNEQTEKLVYEKGKEEACRACHGPVDVGKNLSLANASHRDCLACHLNRRRHELEGGPTDCVGCHDEAAVAAIKRLEEPPRLVRGQPDSAWVKAPDAILPMVAFNHLAHEPQAKFCTSCHHSRLKPCADCHTLRASEEGGGVNLERAYHNASSDFSCVGCHRLAVVEGDCKGCHLRPTFSSDHKACLTCHGGPPPFAGEAPQLAPGSPAVAELAELPAPSDDLPETVTIDLLADAYQASSMPHLKIVTRFDHQIRLSALARQFHGSVEAMCSSCHHHSPAGERPPRCEACHGETGTATLDKPGLKVAYHRQCFGCHQRLGLKQGCTDCHHAKEESS